MGEDVGYSRKNRMSIKIFYRDGCSMVNDKWSPINQNNGCHLFAKAALCPLAIGQFLS